MRQGRYYLGRVIKLGVLNQESFMNAIVKSPVINVGKFNWAITDVVDGRGEGLQYIFGHLSKFSTEGLVKKVDTDEKSQVDELTKNLLVASSPFVYVPQYSGIAYLHVWNQIQEDVFPKRFESIIEAAFDNFFVKCNIEAISDYKSFVAKLRQINRYVEISATVNPPNPMYSRLWKPLKDYVERRNDSELSVKEVAKKGESLFTEIPKIIDEILDDDIVGSKRIPDITDAALLMAADGYGHGKVIGEHDGADIVVRTSDTKKSFLGEKEPQIDELVKLAAKEFELIGGERNMMH